jgi:class 3 adenylate cyclase/tetratricopeptide (TPR) repeat protein
VTAHAGYARGKQLLGDGNVLEAIDHFRAAMAACPDDPALGYGLMLARSRATPGPTLMRELDAILARHDLDPHWRWQFLCIQAKLLKSEGETQPDKLAQSAALYLQAHTLSGDPYPGVNAASLLHVCGRSEQARALAQALLQQLPTSDGDYWLWATRGELCVLLDRADEASAAYAQADRLSLGSHGDRASIRRQLRLLQTRSPALARRLLQASFARPHVVVFSGHRLDDHTASVARFPRDQLPRVSRALQDYAAAHAGGVSYSSAASGGDILFAEAMLEHRARVHIVLPVPPQLFIEASVRDAGPEWVSRFENVLARASRILVAHHAVPEVPDVLFHYTNLLSDGLAQLHTESIDGQLSHCALLNARSRAGVAGGTRHEVERWRARGHAVDIIEPMTANAGTPETVSASVAMPPDESLTLRSMLFADLVGSSRFDPQLMPALLGHFLEEARRLIGQDPVQPLLRNTWGDGLFLVFEHVEDAARLAIRLARELRWPDGHDGPHPEIRVSLHAGPVVLAHDAILERDNVFGHHVIRAARVEPVTPPGEVFATEEAAALLRATGRERFHCVYMGRISMPKGFGETPIYRIDRAS